jgi:hypothetical protein
MISPSLERLRQSRRDDSNAPASHCIDDIQETVLGHANDSEAVLAVILALVEPIEGEGILERFARRFERDTAALNIRNGFRVISLDYSIVH